MFPSGEHYREKGHVFAMKKPTIILYLSYILMAILIVADSTVCEYENTWNFYYEQPCCTNLNGHHLRHHRGKYRHKFFGIFLFKKYRFLVVHLIVRGRDLGMLIRA